MKTVYIIGYNRYSRNVYIMHTSLRTWDNRRIIIPTNEIEKAMQFETEAEAHDFLSKCITNEQHYTVQKYRIPKNQQLNIHSVEEDLV
jgi:hypothetical protein